MRCKLRTVASQRQGAVDFNERVLDEADITIGRAAGAQIYLDDIRVALHHAVIMQEAPGVFVLKALVPVGIRVDGTSVARVPLEPGRTVVQIGGWLLGVMADEPECDLVLEMVPAPKSSLRDNAQSQTSTGSHRSTASWFSSRAGLWTLFATMLFGTLMLPVLATWVPTMRSTLRSWVPFFSDRIWSTGALARGHRFIGDACDKCHQHPFQRTPDTGCVSCHKSVAHHADRWVDDKLPLAMHRCADCHKEHAADTDRLVAGDSRLCTTCHAKLKTRLGDTQLENVTGDFDSGHPELKATFISNVKNRDEKTRLPMSDPKALKERSNLFFSHKLHVAPAGVVSHAAGLPGDDGANQSVRIELRCDSCHSPDSAGLRFQPVKFNDHCERCHKLTFEPNDPNRTVPHGRAEDVLPALKDYYRQHPESMHSADPATASNVRSRPGVAATPTAAPAIAERMNADVDSHAEEVGKRLFEERRACRQCHTVRRTGDNFLSWEIAKVRIAEHWFPKANFSHRAHIALDCKKCHQADESESSEDVMINGVAKCQTCHGGPAAEDKVSSGCIGCHQFHQAEKYLMNGDRRRRSESVLAPTPFQPPGDVSEGR